MNHSSDKLIIFSIVARLDSRLDFPYSILDSRENRISRIESRIVEDSKETVNLHVSGTVTYKQCNQLLELNDNGMPAILMYHLKRRANEKLSVNGTSKHRHDVCTAYTE